jgi:hypothetical protein
MREERERLFALAAQEDVISRQIESQRKPAPGHEPGAKEERRRLAKLQELENVIASLESSLAKISLKLENSHVDHAEVVKLGNTYQSIQKEMDEKLAEWEEMQT